MPSKKALGFIFKCYVIFLLKKGQKLTRHLFGGREKVKISENIELTLPKMVPGVLVDGSLDWFRKNNF